MISLPAIETLQPQSADGLFIFRSESTQLVKLDLLFEAGSAYQTKKLCASAAAKLLTVATPTMDSQSVAEFMDYRGILVENDSQALHSTITFYFLRRFADEVLPVVAEMLAEPSFSGKDFETWSKQRRQEILAAERKTSSVARREFYRALFGEEHPLGRHATVDDLDRLTADDVRDFIRQRYTLQNMTVILAGAVDDDLVQMVRNNLPTSNSVVSPASFAHQVRGAYQSSKLRSPGSALPAPNAELRSPNSITLPAATQTTIRIGRVLPLAWDDMEYAKFMLLATLLGGYFGSRLMSNLREDKGYTYGIYARTQIYRGVIVFYITADVAGGTAEAAVGEVMGEMERLIQEPIAEEELELVKTVLTGDFLRSVDGIFERSARFCDMYATCVDESLTDNLRRALVEATPQDLKRLAFNYLQPRQMTVCTVGV